MYSDPIWNFVGNKILGYDFAIYYDKVEGIEDYYMIYERSGRKHELKINSNSPYKFVLGGAHPIENAYVIGVIGDKQSLPSEYMD